MLGIPWFVASAAGQALCPEDAPAAVDEAVGLLYEAYRTVDDAGFDRTQKNLASAIACLDRAPSPAQIARLHQGMALAAFVNGQSRAARRALASARLSDPAWRPDPDLFPDSHPFAVLFETAGDPGPVQHLGAIKPESWVVDGHETDQAPTDRAFLLQVRPGEGGGIAWSGYLYDRTEVPQRGQAEAEGPRPLETPHPLGVTVALVGRHLASVQDAAIPGWTDRAGGALGGGAAVTARLTPLSVLGGELAASWLGPVDPIAGGGSQPSGHAALTVGGGAWVGSVAPYGSLRLGAAHDRVRAWTGSGPAAVTISGVTSALVGIEGGVRAEAWRAAVAGDGLLAGLREPFQWRARADGGARLGGGPFALEGAFEVRRSAVAYVDGARSAGVRRDADLRLAAGLAWWP